MQGSLSEIHVRNRIRAYARLGLKVNISELDVQTSRVPAGRALASAACPVPVSRGRVYHRARM